MRRLGRRQGAYGLALDLTPTLADAIMCWLVTVYVYVYTLGKEVVAMANVLFLLAALLFAVGVLIGSALHTQAVNRKYRLVAQRVRELHVLEKALAEREEALAGNSRLRA